MAIATRFTTGAATVHSDWDNDRSLSGDNYPTYENANERFRQNGICDADAWRSPLDERYNVLGAAGRTAKHYYRCEIEVEGYDDAPGAGDRILHLLWSGAPGRTH